MDTEGGGEASASTECQSRCNKGYMMDSYLTDSDEEAIVEFVKDHEELCIRKLSVKVCKTWLESQRTLYGKLTQSKSGQAPKKMTER